MGVAGLDGSYTGDLTDPIPSNGVDLRTRSGLDRAFRAADTVVDVSSVVTTRQRAAVTRRY
jgi:hypothetical protein